MLSEGVHVFRLCIAVSLCDAGLLQLKQAFSISNRHLKKIHAGSVDKKRVYLQLYYSTQSKAYY